MHLIRITYMNMGGGYLLLAPQREVEVLYSKPQWSWVYESSGWVMSRRHIQQHSIL